MGFWDDAIAVALDPSTTALATKKAAEKAAAALGAAGTQADATSETAEEATEAVEAATKVCCNEYQIQDGFLLNTKTGAVWIYDESSKSFELVTKEETALQEAARGLVYTLVAEEWRIAKDEELLTLHHSVRPDFEERIDVLTKLLGRKAKK